MTDPASGNNVPFATSGPDIESWTLEGTPSPFPVTLGSPSPFALAGPVEVFAGKSFCCAPPTMA